MKNKNSAHEDITLLIEGEELEALKQSLEAQESDAAQHILHVLDLIQRFYATKQCGDAQVQHTELKLSHESEDADIRISCEFVEEQGWLAHLPNTQSPQNTVAITEMDIEALKQGDFEIEFDQPETLRNLGFVGLLKQMSAYELGRPSTYTVILESLLEENLITLDEDCVRLTEKGLLAVEIFHEHEPALSNKLFSLELARSQGAVADGHMNVGDMLSQYAKQLGQEEAARVPAMPVWRSLSDIPCDEL